MISKVEKQTQEEIISSVPTGAGFREVIPPTVSPKEHG
jgi:hypothetical protein